MKDLNQNSDAYLKSKDGISSYSNEQYWKNLEEDTSKMKDRTNMLRLYA